MSNKQKAINKMKIFFHELFALKYTPWYRWHPQLALRYLPVVEWIKEEGRRKKEEGKLVILEVGSGGLGITPYLKMPITGLDVSFDPPFHPMLKSVIGDATDLKLKNNSFDIVISMDMLEHLPKEKRDKAIAEMVRVAKMAVIIGMPCGAASLTHDKKIQESYRQRFGKEFPFAAEHIAFGLPEKKDMLNAIESAGKRWKKNLSIQTKGNLNLRLRELLMWGWISDNFFINILFRKIFLLCIPLFQAVDRPPYYREIFFIQILKGPTFPYGKVGP